MIDPHRVLEQAGAIIGERGADYGRIEDNFDRIAQIYYQVGGEFFDNYDVAMMMVCVKLARIRQSPKKRDNYVDAINYLAFACELLEAE
mgnify:CR=1 FL=1